MGNSEPSKAGNDQTQKDSTPRSIVGVKGFDLSPGHLAHPKSRWIEFRQPFARKPDDTDENPDCYFCEGTGEYVADGQSFMCMECLPGIVTGRRDFDPAEVFLTVWRGGHSVELLVNTKTWDWEITWEHSGVKAGALTDHEKSVALTALGEKEAQ